MANSKISALTSAATVVGTEVLPIVQSSATVKVAISDLNPGLSTITAVKGGTGQTSYAVGDLLYANTTTTLAKLADVATGNALISGGVGVAPSYGKIGLTTHISGVLPVANGGTNASSASITAFNNITGYSASGATGTTTTNLVFSTSPSITTPTLVGDVTLSTGNLVVSNGKGIDFSATPNTGTSELFDDYEEGTYTPIISGSSSAGSGTYSVQEGRYTKVGNLVYVTAVMTWSAHTGTGNMRLSGLPFTVLNVAGLEPPLSLQVNAVALTALNVALATFRQNATYAEVLQTPVGGGALTDVPIDTAASIRYAGSFLVA